MTVDRSPIFVIAAARSGTKFLRDCLRADQRISAVPYDINYIWRYGQHNSSDDVLSPERLTEAQIRFIRRLVEGQARLRDGKVLLEKSVSNSLRVPFVEAVFPGARYVHLIRDGRDVAASAVKEWSAPPDYRRLLEKLSRIPMVSLPYLLWYLQNSVRHGWHRSNAHARVWGPRYPGIDADVASRPIAEVCAIQWQKSVEFASADLAGIPAGRVFTIKYEDLVRDRRHVVQLAEALKLDSAAIARTYDATVQPGRTRVLTEQEQVMRSQIEAILSKTLRAHGY